MSTTHVLQVCQLPVDKGIVLSSKHKDWKTNFVRLQQRYFALNLSHIHKPNGACNSEESKYPADQRIQDSKITTLEAPLKPSSNSHHPAEHVHKTYEEAWLETGWETGGAPTFRGLPAASQEKNTPPCMRPYSSPESESGVPFTWENVIFSTKVLLFQPSNMPKLMLR